MKRTCIQTLFNSESKSHREATDDTRTNIKGRPFVKVVMMTTLAEEMWESKMRKKKTGTIEAKPVVLAIGKQLK